MNEIEQPIDVSKLQADAAKYRRNNADFAHWASGYGVIEHSDTTQVQIHQLAMQLQTQGVVPEADYVFRILAAADRITSAAMWLVVHMTYAKNVYLDGRDLKVPDFKSDPEGHTGGSLNMVPAYAGYLTANTITGFTRSWLMGQGHCVSAIEAINLLTENMTPAHAERYEVSDAGLSRFVQDFYSYAIRPDGRPESPLGSHVNANTAGGMMEGGYLGFAELQYVHMPMPGESLVTFLSDGAFEEQRGSDWTPRWWRAEDTGLVAPFMIMNGRRIDQRSSMAMKGGAEWLQRHLELNGFRPLHIDGRDPASFVWGIIEMEAQLRQNAEAIRNGDATYPTRIPYGIAETEKGFGFPGAGTNRAHNLPLHDNPSENADARDAFNKGANRLWLPVDELDDAVRMLNRHSVQDRPRERDHPLAHRQVAVPQLPQLHWRQPDANEKHSAMSGIDEAFCDIVESNPQLRVRVGNPDEMRSNRLDRTLDLLKHRVTDPEPGIAEDTCGRVITALNEEAVVAAALANKAGINLVASYEAFAVKMLGQIRQEVIFARHQREHGRQPGWLSVPVFATSHTWENGKNEQSHQDPALCEALLAEMSDVSRVLFPADWNSAVAALHACYSTHGQIWTLVTPKRPLPVWIDEQQSRQLVQHGAVRLRGSGEDAETLLLVAVGGYQLTEVMKASDRLTQTGVEHGVVYLQEPGRFRVPRDSYEQEVVASPEIVDSLFPESASARVFVTHTRPEPLIGTLWPLLKGRSKSPVLGYVNQGGTLNEAGMLFANQSTWAHILMAAAVALERRPGEILQQDELDAIAGTTEPSVLFESG